MFLNLERSGIQVGCEQVDSDRSLALREAQQDFPTVHSGMSPLHQQVDALSAMADDLANLKVALKGIQDSDFGARLSVFASVVFPLTLVASILSMGDDYLPGRRNFWVFWASSLPPALVFALVMLYGWNLNGIIDGLGSLFKRRSEGIVQRSMPVRVETPAETLDCRRWPIARTSVSSLV